MAETTLTKRKWKPNINHDGQTDDLGARLEVAKGDAFCYPRTLTSRPARLNRFCSYSAVTDVNYINVMDIISNQPIYRSVSFGTKIWASLRYEHTYDLH